MHSSSQCPSTPLAPRNRLTYKPLNSSPLACSSDYSKSSPVVTAQARRRSQYKALTPNTPSRTFSNSRGSSGRLFTDGNIENDSQKVFLRDRFKARCFERAAKARAKAIKGKRYANHPSSDDFSMDYSGEDDNDDDEDEDIMQDEVCFGVFGYHILVVQPFFSSFFEESWPMLLGRSTTLTGYLMLKKSVLLLTQTWKTSVPGNENWRVCIMLPVIALFHLNIYAPGTSGSKQPGTEEELTPIDLDDEELAAYAEECAQRAALADFEDIPEEELFSWSDFEEPDEEYGMDVA